MEKKLLEAHDLISVQPMTAPTGQIFTLKPYGELPCCGNYETCNRPCTPRVDYWKQQVQPSKLVSERKDVNLHETTDAKIWTEEFMRINPDADYGTMLAWFANAIMAGHDNQYWKSQKELKYLLKIQGERMDVINGEPYMVGLYNGLEFALALLENRPSEFKKCNTLPTTKEWELQTRLPAEEPITHTSLALVEDIVNITHTDNYDRAMKPLRK